MNKLLGEVAEVIGPIRVALGSDNMQVMHPDGTAAQILLLLYLQYDTIIHG
jgi:hypothetical protein